MKKIIAVFIILVLLVSANILPAQEVLPLADLIKEAQSKNPEILAAKKRWEASRHRIPQMKSLDNPTIGLNFEKIPRSTFQLNNTMPEDRMLSVTQMFPFFGKLPLRGKIALAESQVLSAEEHTSELQSQFPLV